ncbi:MAG: hypothetical protein ACRDHE_17195 [Ktedonobacterales bacterium]
MTPETATPKRECGACRSDFIADGHYARQLRKIRLLYRDRRDALVGALTGELGDLLAVAVPEAGLHPAAWFPSDKSARLVALPRSTSGLALAPMSRDSPRPLQRDGLLFGFASASPDALRAGVQALALALKQ